MKNHIKLSDKIASQLPSVISDEYPVFTDFVESYYRFMESQQVYKNLESIRNIDETLTVFVKQLENEFSSVSPKYKNNKFYVPLLKQHFLTRGTEDSFNLLFKLLFNEQIEIKYPADSILRISDGKWYQDNSIFVKVLAGDISKLDNSYVYIKSGNQNVRAYIETIYAVNDALGIYELFIKRNFYGTIIKGATIESNGLKCVVGVTTSAANIYIEGSGYYINQIFKVKDAFGSGTVLKVIKTGIEGSIKEVQIIQFGYGFKKNFYYKLNKNATLAENYSNPITTKNGIVYGEGYQDKLNRFVDEGYINKVDYVKSTYPNLTAAEYVSTNYVGEVLDYFYDDTTDPIDDSAVIFFKLDTVAKYPGHYSSSDSFISGASFIQDGNYYQDFSYVLKSEQPMANYKSQVLDIAHPTGRKLFAEYYISSSFDIPVEKAFFNTRILLTDTFAAFDTKINNKDKAIKDVGKHLTDSFSVSIDEYRKSDVIKVRKDNLHVQPELELHKNYYFKDYYVEMGQNLMANTYYIGDTDYNA